jgi:hypothetical protein
MIRRLREGLIVFAFPKRALFMALATCIAGSALAADGTPPASGLSRPSATLNLGNIVSTLRYTNASLASGGVGLRNRAEGGIEISGATTPIKRAYIYWAVVTQGAPTTAVNRIDIKRGGAGSTFTTIVGTAIGTGGTPCWLGDRTTVYRGSVPLSIATGNGLYIVRLKPGANASTGGQSPWVVSNPPLFEGVSIVLVGTGASTVAFYDVNLAGRMFFGQLSYRLITPVSMAGSPEVLVLNVGADGQSGVGIESLAGTSDEITTLNGRRIAGPGSPANESDWNGTIAGPLPQLWDNTTHDVTSQALAGASLSALPFVVNAPDDCVVPVVNVVSIHNP